MILAGLTLLAVGGADLIRRFETAGRRRIAMAVGAVALFLASLAVDAAGWSIAAIVVAALWVVSVPRDGSGRAGLWPVGVLGAAAATAVVLIAPRRSTAAFETLWSVPGPATAVPADLVVLVVGVLAFLLESANIVVRTALRTGDVPADADAGAQGSAGLKGGRLIGPLERVLVFALMLAGAYTLIAAVFAAKGIVRFPEISRDSDAGNRAEYFLVGSLVSWVLALAAALLVWWGSR